MRADHYGLPARRALYVFWAVVVILYAAWLLVAGIRSGTDTETYSRWADQLIAMRFDIAAYLREESFVVPPVFYILWITVVAALKVLLGSNWMTGVVVLNWLSFSAGAYATLSSIRVVTASGASMLLAVLLYLVAADLLLFAPFVLSDLIFWGLSTVVLAGAARLAVADDAPSVIGTIVAGTVVLAIALAFRPVAMPLAAVWLVSVIAVPARPFIDRWGQALLSLAVVLAVVAMAIHAYLLMNTGAWPFGPLPAILQMLSDEYRRGVLVYAPESELIVDAATTWLGAMRLTLQKLVFFLTPWLPHYSVAHTLLNLAFFLPAYGLSIAAITKLRRLQPPLQRAAIVLALYVLALSAFHAMMQIEYDHRYRLPMLPAVIMLAAIGLEAVRRPQRLASSVRRR